MCRKCEFHANFLLSTEKVFSAVLMSLESGTCELSLKLRDHVMIKEYRYSLHYITKTRNHQSALTIQVHAHSP